VGGCRRSGRTFRVRAVRGRPGSVVEESDLIAPPGDDRCVDFVELIGADGGRSAEGVGRQLFPALLGVPSPQHGYCGVERRRTGRDERDEICSRMDGSHVPATRNRGGVNGPPIRRGVVGGGLEVSVRGSEHGCTRAICEGPDALCAVAGCDRGETSPGIRRRSGARLGTDDVRSPSVSGHSDPTRRRTSGTLSTWPNNPATRPRGSFVC
jgi:hypothetical protein